MKQTGFPPGVRAAVRQRSDGYCEKCGTARAIEYHHRRPRGMGGSKQADTNTASNCLHCCSPCHALIEQGRDVAINQGWLVTQNHCPADIPVNYRNRWVYLDDLGNLQPVQETL